MMSGRLGQNLIDFATVLVQRFRGGLASVTVVGSMVFGGVSGSAVADATALGSMLIPWQKREGYPPGYVAANNSAAATIAILIPPSIPLILYSLVSGVSVGARPCGRAARHRAHGRVRAGEQSHGAAAPLPTAPSRSSADGSAGCSSMPARRWPCRSLS